MGRWWIRRASVGDCSVANLFKGGDGGDGGDGGELVMVR